MASNLDIALAKIAQAIANSMNDEVAKAVKKEESDSVDEIVYSAGSPIEYKRRDHKNGSLGDVNEMNHTVNTDGFNTTLEVNNDAGFNPYRPPYGNIDFNKSLAYNIEYGYYERSNWWDEPRPFIDDARKKLESGAARDALKRGLEKRLGKGSVV